MVYLSKKDADTIIHELLKTSDKKIKLIINKLKSPEKKKVYVSNSNEIRKLLQNAFDKKRQVKIRYHSPHSDEQTTRIIDIYKIYEKAEAITAFCHLREEERNFRIDRINSAALLDEKYSIPKNWSPECIILEK